MPFDSQSVRAISVGSVSSTRRAVESATSFHAAIALRSAATWLESAMSSEPSEEIVIEI
jgi:hypothetical protein